MHKHALNERITALALIEAKQIKNREAFCLRHVALHTADSRTSTPDVLSSCLSVVAGSFRVYSIPFDNNASRMHEGIILSDEFLCYSSCSLIEQLTAQISLGKMNQYSVTSPAKAVQSLMRRRPRAVIVTWKSVKVSTTITRAAAAAVHLSELT